MRSYVLVGDSKAKNDFVKKFIKEENIPNYNLFDYQETLKIPQVREIKKLLSTKALAGEKRLFIVRDATAEAQNALLKTLEELPEDTSFIFLNEAILIPTILSRARILNFKREGIDIDANLLKKLENFLSAKLDLSSTLLFSDELFSLNPNLTFNDFILSLREILFGKARATDFEKSNLILRLLKSLYKYVPLENNNLNKRILIERLLINEISS